MDAKDAVLSFPYTAEADFKRTYVATFLAGWAAEHYDDFCSRGIADQLVANHPIEDALHQADKVWTRMQRLLA